MQEETVILSKCPEDLNCYGVKEFIKRINITILKIIY
jgi:hypothetical protein